MKSLFLLAMGSAIALFPLIVKKLHQSRNLIYKLMFLVMIPAFVSVLSHCCVIFAPNKVLASAAYSIHFASANWIAAMTFFFCASYADSKISRNLFKILVLPLACIDTIFVLANVVFPFMFKVQLEYVSVYTFIPSAYFYLHCAFGWLLLFYCFGLLFSKFEKTPFVLRVKYSSLAFFILLIALSNVIYVFNRSHYNFSILVYAFSFIGSYQVIVKIIPAKLILKTLALIADNLKNGIILLDTNGKCVYVNAFVRKNFECDESNVMNSTLFSDYFDLRNASHLRPDDTFSSEVYYESATKRMSLLISDSFISEDKFIIGRYYLIENITETKNKIYEEKILRTRDPLTSLYNREYFFEKAEHRLKYDRFTQYFLVVSDIVNFKLINDLYGKPFGDTILVRCANVIRKYVASDVIYGRLFNDHFIMLVPKRHFDEDAIDKALRSEMSYLHNFSYNLIIHMGIYEIEDLSLPVSVMCDRAFLALKTIADDYKNSFGYYDDSLRLDVLKMQLLMNELPLALKNGQVKMYLQPQVKKDGTLVGAEALVRWHHPQRGIIPPCEFIEIIERINIISDIDTFMWECACAKLAEWKAKGLTDKTISVNISAKDFFTMDLLETFMGLVRKYDISPSNLNLEITETAVIFDLENQLKLLDKLRKAGFVIEMDDFGSGYSSLNMLRDISVDVLKIDMGFLQKSENDRKNRIILERIVMLAKDLGMKVLTEGVENEQQVEFLSKVGCDLFQGFLFSRPIPVEEFEEKYFGCGND